MLGGRKTLQAIANTHNMHYTIDTTKVSELLRKARKAGCYISDHGAEHDEWTNPKTGGKDRIPRHQTKELGVGIAKSIMKNLGLK